jgi:glycosyltransferase involved in cell wall biosynthesis
MKKPLRICLMMQGGRGWIGGTEYIKNITFALSNLPSDVRSTFELCLLCSKSLESSLYNQIQPLLDSIYYQEVDLEPLTPPNRIYWKLRQILLKQYNSRIDAFLKKANIDFIYPYVTQNRRYTPARSAVWIADFQYKYLPHLFSEQEIRNKDKDLALIAKYSSTVILSSKTAEADFQKFCPEAAHKSQVLSFRTIPSPSWYDSDTVETQHKYSLSDRFFLVSNQFWKHKNHLVIFQALKLLQEQSIYPIVVCTGHLYDNRQPDYSDTILQTIHNLGIAQQVHLLGLIPRSDQIQLMRRSLAVIQPSLFEGWSTIVEDARALGKRMILSDFPVHLEQNPPHSIFFDGNSPESLAPLLAKWWEQLSPGPNIEQEALARTNNIEQVQAFGYRFLEIAKTSA